MAKAPAQSSTAFIDLIIVQFSLGLGYSTRMKISAAGLRAYRRQTYRLGPRQRVTTPEQALTFVDERRFVYFWPIKGVDLPSLWAAVAGDRPVANAHDDPGHVTWGWKDAWLGARRWYYAKVLRAKATLIALEAAPAFYALSDNFGDYQHDYLEQYAAGALTAEAKAVYEALLEKGPQHTLALRRNAGLSARPATTRFERALSDLQTRWLIVPVGVAEAGAWRYSFVYDIVARHYPDLPAQAQRLTRGEARCLIAGWYLDSVGAATRQQAQRLFAWSVSDTAKTWHELQARDRAWAPAEVAGQAGDWLAVPALARR
jgi:hypothetical protein